MRDLRASLRKNAVWASRQEAELFARAEEIIADTLIVWQDPVTLEAAEKAKDKLGRHPQFKCVLATMMEFAITVHEVDRTPRTVKKEA